MADSPSHDEIRTRAAAASGLPAGALLRLLRPRQWTKNLLVFAALVFAEKLFDAHAVRLALLGFASFCMASSSVYVVNDLVDVERDRQHPEKRHRPIAAGDVGRATAWGLAALLTAAALGLAFWIAAPFGAAVLIYVGLTHFYSFAGKNVAIVDVLLIASGFVLRAVGGALAIDVPSSDWFILFTLFAALFVALSKRRAEILALESGAGDTRPVLDRYTASTLGVFVGTSMGAVLISYSLYVFHAQRQSGDEMPLLALTLPFVIYGVFRYHLLVETEGQGEKPEEIFLTDRPSQLCVLGFALVAMAAFYL